MAILSSVIKIKQINIAMHWLMVAQYLSLTLFQRNFRMLNLKQLFFCCCSVHVVTIYEFE